MWAVAFVFVVARPRKFVGISVRDLIINFGQYGLKKWTCMLVIRVTNMYLQLVGGILHVSYSRFTWSMLCTKQIGCYRLNHSQGWILGGERIGSQWSCLLLMEGGWWYCSMCRSNNNVTAWSIIPTNVLFYIGCNFQYNHTLTHAHKYLEVGRQQY